MRVCCTDAMFGGTMQAGKPGLGYGCACDMWSIGVIAYMILCGQAPFDGAWPRMLLVPRVEDDIGVVLTLVSAVSAVALAFSCARLL